MAGKVTPPVLSALYRRAVAFVYVPLAEGYGLPVLEAMVTRTPVVSSPVPAASGATLLVDPFDPDSIASGITTVCLDTAVRDALIARGNDLARSRTWAHVARRHVDLWRRLGAELPSP
jgi:glycosyltransferase involved in cell wall biosynthesis